MFFKKLPQSNLRHPYFLYTEILMRKVVLQSLCTQFHKGLNFEQSLQRASITAFGVHSAAADFPLNNCTFFLDFRALCLIRPLGSISRSAFLAEPWLLSRRSNFLVKAWEWSASSGKGKEEIFNPCSSCEDVVHALCVSNESVEQPRTWKKYSTYF